MKAFSFLACLLALALVGCKGGGDVVGKWKGEIKVTSAAKDDPMAKMMEGLASMLTMDLELKPDHKYTMTVMMISMDGDWSLSGNRVTLTPKTIMGMSPEEFKKQQEQQMSKSGNPMAKADPTQDPSQPLTLEVQGDGTMKMLPPAGSPNPGGGDLVFTRQPS